MDFFDPTLLATIMSILVGVILTVAIYAFFAPSTLQEESDKLGWRKWGGAGSLGDGAWRTPALQVERVPVRGRVSR
jgi:hypothetical protein